MGVDAAVSLPSHTGVCSSSHRAAQGVRAALRQKPNCKALAGAGPCVFGPWAAMCPNIKAEAVEVLLGARGFRKRGKWTQQRRGFKPSVAGSGPGPAQPAPGQRGMNGARLVASVTLLGEPGLLLCVVARPFLVALRSVAPARPRGRWWPWRQGPG